MEHKNTNMQLDWDLEKGKLTIVFTYPFVHLKCIDEKKNMFSSSMQIVSDAIHRHLKASEILYSNSSSFERGQILTLHIKNDHKNISFKKLNKILFELDEQIRTEIYNLINP